MSLTIFCGDASGSLHPKLGHVGGILPGLFIFAGRFAPGTTGFTPGAGFVPVGVTGAGFVPVGVTGAGFVPVGVTGFVPAGVTGATGFATGCPVAVKPGRFTTTSDTLLFSMI